MNDVGILFLAGYTVPPQTLNLFSIRALYLIERCFPQVCLSFSPPVSFDTNLSKVAFSGLRHVSLSLHLQPTNPRMISPPLPVGFRSLNMWNWCSLLGQDSSFPKNNWGFLPNVFPFSFKKWIRSHRRWLVGAPHICLIRENQLTLQEHHLGISNVCFRRTYVFLWHQKENFGVRGSGMKQRNMLSEIKPS